MTTAELRFVNSYIDKNNPKFELNGALFDKGRQKIVATDTRAIIALDAEFDFDGIIQKKVFDLSIKATTKTSPLSVKFNERILDSKQMDKYMVSDRLLEISSDEIVISSPEIRGSFPAWERIMNPIEDIKLQYDFSEGETKYKKVGDRDVAIPKMKVVESDAHMVDFEIARLGAVIDAKYTKPLVELMSGYADSKVEIYFTNENNPVRIEHKTLSLVIMPIVR